MDRIRLRTDLAVLPLDDDVVVFSEETQCLVALNRSGAFIFGELQKGTPMPELRQALVREGFAHAEVAGQWVAATVEALGSHGLLADGRLPPAPVPIGMSQDDAERTAGIPAYVPEKSIAERRYRLLETCVLMRFSHPGQLRVVETVIGHLAAGESRHPDTVFEIQAVKLDDGHLRSNVYRDGVAVTHAPRLSHLGPVVKGALWQAAINAYDFLFYIHAGVVGTGEKCILLPAAAGSGKSSLTAALTNHGFRYFSDEVALIDRHSFEVPAMPLAICAKSTGWDLISRYYPHLSTLTSHWRNDGKQVRYIPPPPSALSQAPAPVSHLIFPLYDKDVETEMRPIARAHALGRLMDECLAVRRHLDMPMINELVRWIGTIDCYLLPFSSLDRATELVVQLARAS